MTEMNMIQADCKVTRNNLNSNNLRDGNASRKAGHGNVTMFNGVQGVFRWANLQRGDSMFQTSRPWTLDPQAQDCKTSRPQGFKTSRGLRSGSSPLRGAQGVPCRGGGGRARVLAPCKFVHPVPVPHSSSAGGELRVCREEVEGGTSTAVAGGGYPWGVSKKKVATFTINPWWKDSWKARAITLSLVLESCEGWFVQLFPSRCTCLAAHASTVDKNMTIEITTSRSERYNPFLA
ncbi:hypothetical protein K438DRAFT_1753131 [Mycena galopus ATCC 62051]|nr:hypothetical protein K438DRAFT_1753131 [Mycena galopus ATCC 62051]